MKGVPVCGLEMPFCAVTFLSATRTLQGLISDPFETQLFFLLFFLPVLGRQLVEEVFVDLVLLEHVLKFGHFTRSPGKAGTGETPARMTLPGR